MKREQYRGCVDGESARDANTNPNHAPMLSVFFPERLAAHLYQMSALEPGASTPVREQCPLKMAMPLLFRPCLPLPKRNKKTRLLHQHRTTAIIPYHVIRSGNFFLKWHL